jgi:ABC-type transport system involved in cytochrome c biogenesis permease subunit
MYHVQVVLGLSFLPLFALLRRRGDYAWLAPHFALVSCLPMIGTFFLERDLQWRRMPALQSPWFVPHVLSYMVSYSLLAVAFAALVWGLVIAWRKGESALQERSRKAVYALTRLAFPLMTFGLLSGALWAEEAWGVYWSWDPKETWSLITWTLYLIYFHARLSPRTRRFETVAHLLAFAALLTTFVLVNIVSRFGGGLHSYS